MSNIRLIHAPTGADGPFAPVKGFLELGAIFDHPPVNGGVIYLHPQGDRILSCSGEHRQ